MLGSSPGKKTPLFQEHVNLGAKILEFGGWQMPLSYNSVLIEHQTVREKSGLFDVSHMGELRLKGEGALPFVQKLCINDASLLKKMQGQYSAICNPEGGMLDDLFVYKLDDDDFLICINAANIEKDYEWFLSHAKEFSPLDVINESEKWGQLAIQGPYSPCALKVLLSSSDGEAIESLKFTEATWVKIKSHDCIVARTGYTGEQGFEIFIPKEILSYCWQTLLEKNQRVNLAPIGLGARDTLRLEAGFLLYGNDASESVSPLEAGISWATKLAKKDFIGKEALVEEKINGPKRKLFTFELVDRGIPRRGMKIYNGDTAVGSVTSGSFLPTLNCAGGLALIDAVHNVGDLLSIDIRGQFKKIKLVPKPFYRSKAK